jgi:hypothetical protein
VSDEIFVGFSDKVAGKIIFTTIAYADEIPNESPAVNVLELPVPS